MSNSYRVVSRHAEDLADGRTVQPGDEVKLDAAQADDAHNKRLIVEGLLIPIEPPKTQKGADK